ncbi:Uncharacterised protein [Bordetella ansorpii]|uniref:Uncharacterized protein n=1 Tax=Bordetella ansorpii TaxID=288768 RepID=A0A157RM01_9BORD|nr:hypothetical protein [Bordetella ansorpii]SAI58985.1 Uncharacterised protein [Bordetella ansorpii]
MEKNQSTVISMTSQQRVERLRRFSRDFALASDNLSTYLNSRINLTETELERAADLEGALTAISLEWCRFTAMTRH